MRSDKSTYGTKGIEGITCVVDGDGTYRSVTFPTSGFCYRIDGEPVEFGMCQVETGHAHDCQRFSKGRYAAAEAKVRTAGPRP